MATVRDSLTPEWLKSSFLLGIDLTLDDGSDYPDLIYEQSIESALSYVEHELGIVIDPVEVRAERHDALDINRSAWWPLRLDRRPVLEIDSFEIKFGNYAPVTVPISWCQIMSYEHGQVHLIPSEESLGSYLFRAGVPLMMGDTMTPYAYIPGYFVVGYTAGFSMREGTDSIADGETDVAVVFDTPMASSTYFKDFFTAAAALGKIQIRDLTTTGCTLRSSTPAAGGNGSVLWGVTTVPSDIKHVIGLKAALLPIDVAGDLIAGAGVATYSIGADGIHQSLGTTSSATNSGYGARRLAFERELKALLPALRAKYKTMNFGVI
jgi:hypothetical protein